MEKTDNRTYSYEEIRNMEEEINFLRIENNAKNQQIKFLQDIIKNIWRQE